MGSPHLHDALTDEVIWQAPRQPKKYKIADGGSLSLVVQHYGPYQWVWRYRLNGVYRAIFLGTYPEVPIGDARWLRDYYRTWLKRGFDPKILIDLEKAGWRL